jgi:hypothetical protein
MELKAPMCDACLWGNLSMKSLWTPLLLGLFFAPLGSLMGDESFEFDHRATATDMYPRERDRSFKLGAWMFQVFQPEVDYRFRCDTPGALPTIVKDSSWWGWSATRSHINDLRKNAAEVCNTEWKKAKEAKEAILTADEQTRLARLEQEREAEDHRKEMFKINCPAYFADPTSSIWDLAPETVQYCKKVAQEEGNRRTGQRQGVCREQIAAERGEAWLLSREAGRLYRAKDYVAARAKYREASESLKRARALISERTHVQCVNENKYTVHAESVETRNPAGAPTVSKAAD